MDSNSAEDPARRNELTRKWRTVLGLNILVSAINGKGHPNFRWEASIQSEKEPSQHSLLKYLVAILVRNNDIVAAVAHKRNVVANAQSGGIHVNIMGTEFPAAPLQRSGLASGMGQNDQGTPIPTSFTAVANPHTAKLPLVAEHRSRKSPGQDPYFATKSPDIDCFVVAGESHVFDNGDTALWPSILKIGDDEPLENHVATVAKYIELVQSHSSEHDVMALLTPAFMQYMVGSSWQKMYRRITHWSAQGFIYHLSKVEENALRAAVEPTVTALRNDSQLSTKFITIEEYSSTFPSLFSACQSMQSMPWPSEPEQSKERSGLYNKATCFEFHRLLVSTLVDYGMALEKLADVHETYSKQRDEENLAKMETYVTDIWKHGLVLWAIAYSRILEDHLDVLRKLGWLPLPVNDKTELDLCSGVTGFKRKPRVIANPPSVVGEEADRDGGDAGEGRRDEVGQGDGDTVKGGEDGAGRDDEYGVEGGAGFKRKPHVIANPPSVVGDEADRDGGDAGEGRRDEVGQGDGDTVRGGEDGAGRDDEDGVEAGTCENEDITSIIDNALLSADKNFAKVYQDWIRLQVDRWQAPRKITSFVRRVAKQGTIDLNLLAVRHPEPMAIHEAMEPWENTITDLYARIRDKPKGQKAEDVIRVLNDIVDKPRWYGMNEVPHSIFRKFDRKRAKNGQFQATVHCEAVLAALAKFPSRAAGDSVLRECLQDIDSSSIAVSKPCCPVCWELLSTLRDDGSHDFHVDGHHKTLFQVELPSWLPLEVVQELTQKFEGYLLLQIRTLMANHGRHAIIPSGQSAHDFSSDSSDDEEDHSNGLRHERPVDMRSLRLVLAKQSRERRTLATHSSSDPM